jgi:hypothetical protein
MSPATTRRLAKPEQAAAGPRNRPVLIAVDQAEVDRLAADPPGALIIGTGGPRALGGCQV